MLENEAEGGGGLRRIPDAKEATVAAEGEQGNWDEQEA